MSFLFSRGSTLRSKAPFIAKAMQAVRQDGNGERLFSYSEVLTATQIQSFFSLEGQDVGDFSKMTQKMKKLSKWKKNLKTFEEM